MQKSLSQIAFEAYTNEKGGIAYDGTPIPAWENLSKEVKSGWRAAVQAVIDDLRIENYMDLSEVEI